MNKTVLIVGGASVASLAVGATGGYFIAKKKFDDAVDSLISAEVEKTKKYFSLRIQELENGKPTSVLDVPVKDEEDESEPEAEEELSDADKEVIAKGRQSLAEASSALTNYQAFSDKPDLEELVTHNIFTPKGKKALPPRGPKGQFLPKNATQNQKKPEETPYLIEQDEYLTNDSDYEQRQLRYFKNDNTLIDPEDNNEAVDNAVVGEVNLTLFPEVGEGEMSIICVRNEGLQTDYEIQLVEESLTEYLGLGENEGGFDDMDAPDTAHAYANEN